MEEQLIEEHPRDRQKRELKEFFIGEDFKSEDGTFECARWRKACDNGSILLKFDGVGTVMRLHMLPYCILNSYYDNSETQLIKNTYYLFSNIGNAEND